MIEPQDLPTVRWDFVYGTNLQHGLMLARKMLAHEHGSKQIIMITDGEPTAHIVPYAEGVGYDVRFNYPPIPETLELTLAEVVRCTRAGITINAPSCSIPIGGCRASSSSWPGSIRGRTFATSPEELGDYVLVDFLGPQDHCPKPGSPRRLMPGHQTPGPPQAEPGEKTQSCAFAFLPGMGRR